MSVSAPPVPGGPACTCGAVARSGELIERVATQSWLIETLRAVAASGLPNAWVGAGALRDVVWGQIGARGFEPSAVRDVDVAFFDDADLSRRRDQDATEALARILDRPWEATNQAGVHTWYDAHFGEPPVAPLRSVHDGIGTWPEVATSVAVRLRDPAAAAAGAWAGGAFEICAPHGLDDLLDGVWRRNPARVSVEMSVARLVRHRVADRWPAVAVIRPDR